MPPTALAPALSASLQHMRTSLQQIAKDGRLGNAGSQEPAMIQLDAKDIFKELKTREEMYDVIENVKASLAPLQSEPNVRETLLDTLKQMANRQSNAYEATTTLSTGYQALNLPNTRALSELDVSLKLKVATGVLDLFQESDMHQIAGNAHAAFASLNTKEEMDKVIAWVTDTATKLEVVGPAGTSLEWFVAELNNRRDLALGAKESKAVIDRTFPEQAPPPERNFGTAD